MGCFPYLYITYIVIHEIIEQEVYKHGMRGRGMMKNLVGGGREERRKKGLREEKGPRRNEERKGKMKEGKKRDLGKQGGRNEGRMI